MEWAAKNVDPPCVLVTGVTQYLVVARLFIRAEEEAIMDFKEWKPGSTTGGAVASVIPP
jgi:hypothetical protein